MIFIAILLQLSCSTLNKKDLTIALSVYRYDHQNNLQELQKVFNKALNKWEIKEEELHGTE